MNWETITQIDRRHIWHPYAAMPNTQPVYAVARAEGCSIELADGKRLVDGTSSWWAALHGYNHPRLNAAAHAVAAGIAAAGPQPSVLRRQRLGGGGGGDEDGAAIPARRGAG